MQRRRGKSQCLALVLLTGFLCCAGLVQVTQGLTLDCSKIVVPGYNGGTVDISGSPLGQMKQINAATSSEFVPSRIGSHVFEYDWTLSLCKKLDEANSCVPASNDKSLSSFVCVRMTARKLKNGGKNNNINNINNINNNNVVNSDVDAGDNQPDVSLLEYLPVVLNNMSDPNVEFGDSSDSETNGFLQLSFTSNHTQVSSLPRGKDAASSNSNFTLVLRVQCNKDPVDSKKSLRLTAFNSTWATFEFEDKLGCLKNGGEFGGFFGSIGKGLLIIFGLASAYMVGGFLYRRFVLHEVGVNQIPHYDFLVCLPGRIAEVVGQGIAAVVGCVRGRGRPAGYVQI